MKEKKAHTVAAAAAGSEAQAGLQLLPPFDPFVLQMCSTICVLPINTLCYEKESLFSLSLSLSLFLVHVINAVSLSSRLFYPKVMEYYC